MPYTAMGGQPPAVINLDTIETDKLSYPPKIGQ